MSNLDAFLKNHIPDDNQSITHTRMKGEGIFPGKYHISPEDLPLFYKLYHKKVFIKKQFEYLVERPHKNKFPILIDLDFRFDKAIEKRQHNDEHIIDIIDVYLDKLHQILNITDRTEFPIFVFEKPNVNLCSDITKDGIHIIIGITMDSTLQGMLRSLVLEDINEIVKDLNPINEIDTIVDICVSRGTQGFQMYGSRKPGNEAYAITHYYNAEWEGGEWSSLDEINITNYDMMDLLLKVSARKMDNISYEINDNIREAYEKRKKSINNKIHRAPKQPIHHYGFVDYSKITNEEVLTGVVEEFLDGLSVEEYNIREIHQFTMILPKKYYNDYDEWLRVGFALHNVDKRMFITWILFSSQCDKFDFSEIPNYLEIWHGMRADGLTGRSIMYWAKENNLEGYKKIHDETIDYYIDKTISANTDHNLALVLYKMFEGQFICASIKNKVWYEFKHHKWEAVDSGTTLRNHITKKVAAIYNKKIVVWKDKMTEGGSDEEVGIYQKKMHIGLSITLKMGNVDGKNRIMREAQELFYNKHFFEKLDANPYLLHFTNGVIDFSADTRKNIFREGKPDDFISLTTKHRYEAFDKKNKEHIKYKAEIDEFFDQLFTNNELRRYMLEHLASTLIGTNENETFNIYNGVGRNGKSKLVDLMGKVLGELKGVVPLSLVTRKREGSGKASPELARLRGVRYAVMQEPSKNDKINEGQMKELTGGDAIQARALFRDPIEFKPQFKLAVCTNNLFDVQSNDDGTWRRIRVCEFLSKFCLNPSQDSKDKEFKGIAPSKLLKKFDRWLLIFTAMLVDIAYKTQGRVVDCEMVLAASKKYRGSQDYFGKYFDENIEKFDGGFLKLTAPWEEFKDWWVNMGLGRQVPKRMELQSFLEKKMGIYPKKGWKNYRLIHQYQD